MKKIIVILLIILFSLSAIFVFQYVKFYDKKLHLVFCDVGQGDAIFIRTPKGSDILIDGGPASPAKRGEPDNSVLSCLAEHMPFWDRDLELVVLTHPHADHLNGLIKVFGSYKIDSFATEMIKNNTGGFTTLMEQIKKENIKTHYVYSGDRFVFKDSLIVKIAGPSKEFVRLTSPGGTIGEKKEFASVLSLIEYKDFEVLLTGDSQASGLQDTIDGSRVGDIDILQVPHHGSKTGLTSDILGFVKPELAVISVGKNSYGHPAPSILEILGERGINPLRTDQMGNIEIISDGKGWAVNSR